jgi:hypothetical protein
MEGSGGKGELTLMLVHAKGSIHHVEMTGAF